MKRTKGVKTAPKAKGRFKDAEKDYQKMLEEILPFVKQRKTKPRPSYGKWTSSRVDGA